MNQEGINTCKGCYKNWEPKREDVPTKYILKFKCELDGLSMFLKTNFCNYVTIYWSIESRKGCVRRNLDLVFARYLVAVWPFDEEIQTRREVISST